ncbi:MAG: hypothetical protein ACK56I_19980, partial [bacterium]
ARRMPDVAALAADLAPFASTDYGEVRDAPARVRAILSGSAAPTHRASSVPPNANQDAYRTTQSFQGAEIDARPSSAAKGRGVLVAGILLAIGLLVTLAAGVTLLLHRQEPKGAAAVAPSASANPVPNPRGTPTEAPRPVEPSASSPSPVAPSPARPKAPPSAS